jgi:hypothetical protein
MFVQSVRAWQNVVRIGAINCAITSNQQVCRQNDVRGTPTIKVCLHLMFIHAVCAVFPCRVANTRRWFNGSVTKIGECIKATIN